MSARLGTLGNVNLTAGLVVPGFVPTGWTDIYFTDNFAGAGGSSIGPVGAGLNLKLAANHSRRAFRSAKKLLRALDDVLDPKQSDPCRVLSTHHLQQRVEREQQALRQAS